VTCVSMRCGNAAHNGLTENDGHENDGPKMTTGREVAGEQDNITMKCVQIFRPKAL